MPILIKGRRCFNFVGQGVKPKNAKCVTCNTCNSSLVHTCTSHCVLNHFDWILYAGSIIRKSQSNTSTKRARD